MAIRSKPHHVSWELKAKNVEEINIRLATQLTNINYMLDTLFGQINNRSSDISDLEARIISLEARVSELEGP